MSYATRTSETAVADPDDDPVTCEGGLVEADSSRGKIAMSRSVCIAVLANGFPSWFCNSRATSCEPFFLMAPTVGRLVLIKTFFASLPSSGKLFTCVPRQILRASICFGSSIQGTSFCGDASGICGLSYCENNPTALANPSRLALPSGLVPNFLLFFNVSSIRFPKTILGTMGDRIEDFRGSVNE